MMISYIRTDLQASIHARIGEYHATSPSRLTRLQARLDFGKAVVVGMASSVIYLIAITLLIIPHTLVSLNNRYLDIVSFQKVRQLFYLSTGRFKASLAISFVAFISIFNPHYAALERNACNAKLDVEWLAYKNRLRQQFHQRLLQVQQQMMGTVADNEIYKLQRKNGKPYFLELAEELEARVNGYCDGLALAGQVDGKHARYEQALGDIDLYVNRAYREFDHLPLTYRDVAIWSGQEAQKLQRQTLDFFDQEAPRPAQHQKTLYPRKFFDSPKYEQNVATYRVEVVNQLSRHVQQIHQQRNLLLHQWNEVRFHQGHRKRFENRVIVLRKTEENARWFLEILSFMPQLILNYFQARAASAAMERVQVEDNLNQATQAHAASVNQIVNGVFLAMNGRLIDMKNAANRLTGDRGTIVKKLESFAKPTWGVRIWRNVASVFKWIPCLHTALESRIDPDVN